MNRVKERRKRASLALLVLLVAATSAHAQGQDLVITGATVIDGTGREPLEATTVVVRGGRIVALAPDAEVAVPEGATVIDAAGKFIIPGLADMHVHFATGGFVRDEHTVERVLRQFLFYGVTTVLSFGSSGGNLEDTLALRQLQAEDRLPSPHIYATGGLITVPGSHPVSTILTVPPGEDPNTYDWTRSGVWILETPEQVREVVGRVADAGMDGVKIIIESGPTALGDDHPQLSPELIAAAVEGAREHGLPVFAHATSIDELEDAVEAGVHAVVHMVTDPEPPSTDLLAMMEEKNIYYVPTLSLGIWPDVWEDPSENFTDPFLRAGVEERVIQNVLNSPQMPTEAPGDADWEFRRAHLRALKAAYDAQLEVVAGSDTGNPAVFPGYSMHHELELLVEAGLTPMEALVSATRRAAEMMGQEDVFGTLEPGMRADLLILAANPLENIRNTRTLEVVVRGGKIIDRSSLFEK